MEELKDIKILRKKVGLTQTALAKHAGVSQSLVAKIERGVIEPGFTSVQKLFAALYSLEQEHSLTAADLMQKKIISITKKDSLETTIKVMKKHGISQLPVIEDGKPIGLIAESDIIANIFKKQAASLHVGKVMGPCPPIVPLLSSKEIIVALLRFFPLILVSDKGTLQGIITKADVLQTAFTR